MNIKTASPRSTETPRPFKINQGAPSGVLVREVKQHRGREHFVNCGVLLKQREAGSLLLLGHADGATTTAGGLGVLAAHTQTAGRETNQVRTSVTKD